MSKLKRIQKVLMLLIAVATVVLVGSSMVKALTPSNDVTQITMGYQDNGLGDYDLHDSKMFYCVNLGAGFSYPEILNRDSVKTIRSDNPYHSSRILAYILYHGEKGDWVYTDKNGNKTEYKNGGYYNYSPYQIALWKWYNTYSKGYKDPYTYYKKDLWEVGNALFEEAKLATENPTAYSNGTSASVKLSEFRMWSQKGTNSQEGQFTISKLKGNITDVIVTWDNGDVATFKADTDFNEEMKKGIYLYTDKDTTKRLSKLSDFNNTIYVVNTKHNENGESINIANIRIDVKKDCLEGNGYKVKITNWENVDREWKQDLISVEVEEGIPSSAYDVKKPIIKKTIKLIKKDSKYENKLKEAEFMIYVDRENNESGWLNSGKPLETNNLGEIEIEIEDIKTLYLYEVKAPEGYELKDQNGYMNIYQFGSTDLDASKASGTEELKEKGYQEWVCNGRINIKEQKVDSTNGNITKYENKKNTCEIDIYNELSKSSLTITKIDAETGKKLEGAQFILYYVNTNKTEEEDLEPGKDFGWLTGVKDEKSIYTSSIVTVLQGENVGKIEHGLGVYQTDKDGMTKIEHLRTGTYYVYEIKAPQDYKLSEQIGYPEEKDKSIKKEDITEELVQKYGEAYGELVQCNTDKNVIEQNKTLDWAYCGSVEVTNDPTPENTYPKPYEQNEMDNRILVSLNAEMEVKNREDKKVNLQGFVWEDVAPNKDYNYNYIYDKNDILLEGIPVYLRRIGASKEESLIAETTTKNRDGKIEYLFEDLDEKDVENAYVEFGYDNTKYVVVDYNVGEDNKINSKAQEQLMEQKELDDSNLTGINGNCPGRAVTMQKTKALMLARELDEKAKKDTYKYINLGLIPKMEHTFNVKEEISKVTVKLNNFDYSYPMSYDNDIDTEIASEYVPKVSDHYQEFYMYPAEATYTGKLLVSESEAKANKDGLQVLVQYDIQIFNNTPESKNIDVGREAKLFLSKLENHYDKNRYELVGDSWSDPDKTGVAVYNLNDNNLDKGIYKNKPGKTTITFKVKPQAIARLLTNKPDEADVEESPTKTYAIAYHEYLRTDNVWDHNSSIKAYDENSTQETSKIKEYKEKLGIADNEICYLHKSKPIEEKSGALYFGLKLGADRVISGTVFEDEAKTENKKYLGNGVLDSKENRVRAVQVDLMCVGENGLTVAKLQKYDNSPNVDNAERYTEEDASTKTNALGEYKFEGVMPGNYFLRFTYGDGKQVLCNTKGVELSKDNRKVYLRDYKSTIISKEDNAKSIKVATMVSDDQQKKYINTILTEKKDSEEYQKARTALSWYANIGNNYSIALDKLDQREQFDGYIYNKGVEDEKYFYAEGEKDSEGHPYRTTINADSPFIYVSIENDNNIKDERNIAYKSDKNNTKLMRNENNEEVEFIVNKEQVTYHNKEYGGFNFGIVKQPKTVVDLEKKITNVYLSNSGTELINANPESKEAKYMASLKAVAGGSQQVKIEMERDLIYGAKLIPTYEITLTNNSDYDYIEEKNSTNYGNYYKYGDISSDATLKKVTIHKVVDKIDKKYDIVEAVNGEMELTKNSDENVNYNNLSITNIGELEIEGNNKSKSVIYKATDETTALENDLEYENTAELTQISLSNLTILQKDFKWPGDDENANTSLTIYPPTGANRSYTYVIAGAISLIVIAAGIVIVKKNVL